MGECGPTATQNPEGVKWVSYSRWGNAGQPQLPEAPITMLRIIADGGMRANRNTTGHVDEALKVIADGGMRANRNSDADGMTMWNVIADGGMRANRNSRACRVCRLRRSL